MYSNCEECDFNLERYKVLLKESESDLDRAFVLIHEITEMLGVKEVTDINKRITELKEKEWMYDRLQR